MGLVGGSVYASHGKFHFLFKVKTQLEPTRYLCDHPGSSAITYMDQGPFTPA